MLDDDVSSDSGLETEAPISRKKVIHGSSVKRTGMYAAMYYTEKYRIAGIIDDAFNLMNQ